jgi:lysophospholipase L1-like esterase
MVDDHGFRKKELSDDGLHPNKDGYAVMAPLAERAIATALNAGNEISVRVANCNIA